MLDSIRLGRFGQRESQHYDKKATPLIFLFGMVRICVNLFLTEAGRLPDQEMKEVYATTVGGSKP